MTVEQATKQAACQHLRGGLQGMGRYCSDCDLWWPMDALPGDVAADALILAVRAEHERENRILTERLRAALDDAPRALKLERERAEHAEQQLAEARQTIERLEREHGAVQLLGYVDQEPTP